jgi:hypothetical protein
MIDISFEPVADAPGIFTSEPLASGQSDRIRAMVHVQTALLTAECDAKGKTPGLSRAADPGFDAVAFGLSGIWDAAEDLTSRAWDAISGVLTNEGGAGGGGGGGDGARIVVSRADVDIVTTTRAPVLSR